MSGYVRIFAVFTALLLSSCSSVPRSSPAVVPLAPAAPSEKQPDGNEACRAAVAAAASRPVTDTSIMATETSRAGLAAKVALKGAARPWLCIASPEGIVQNVSYMGEG